MSLPVPGCHSGTLWHFVVATVELSDLLHRYLNSCSSLQLNKDKSGIRTEAITQGT